MPKWLSIGLGVAVCVVVLGWVRWYYSPMREIERSRDAVAAMKSWHYHTVRYIGGYSPDTWDNDILCPKFGHTVQSGTRSNGDPVRFESISYAGHSYVQQGDHWILSGGTQSQINENKAGTIEILECRDGVGPIGADMTAKPYAEILDGKVERGADHMTDDGDCRDYNVTVDTPNDPVEKQPHFSICINEQDHLPRETRRILPGATHETISNYSKWGALHDPPLPPDIPN